MSWSWAYQTGAGETAVSSLATAESFPSQSDAESWLGEVWRELLDDGVDQVLLLEEGRLVYGPMSLQPKE